MMVASKRIVLLALTYVATADAIIERLFFSLNAHLVDTRLDPLVNPDSCAAHVHSVFGSIDFASTITRGDFNDPNWQDDTGKADQTTSHIVPNRSMYWAPSLYIYNPADQLYYIVPSFSRSYYRVEYRQGDISSIKPIPQFLRLFVGDASRRTEWADSDVHDHISWTVRSNRQVTNHIDHGDWRYLRNNPRLAADEDQLEMNIDFPNCLQVNDDGTPVLSSPNFRSHASYADDGLVCPDEFPYHIPIVNLEVRYNLEAMRELLGREVVDNIDAWHMSNLDSSGASAHADFVSGTESASSVMVLRLFRSCCSHTMFSQLPCTGWPEEFIANAIEFCRRNTGPQCLAGKYESIDTNAAERRDVALRPNMMLPNEEISPVRRIPQGDCPEMKAVGKPNGPVSTPDETDNGLGSGDDGSENGPHDKSEDDAVCPCTGTFFIICWFFRCLLDWLF
jgi:Domain of unknown function (DUF1996)